MTDAIYLRILITVMVLAIFVMPGHGYTADDAAWVEAVGEAYLSEMETPKEAMERAKRDALTKAIEKARGIFLKSHTLVANYQLADDLIYAAVRGKVDRYETIRAGWDRDNRSLYRINIKAFIAPVYPEKGQGLSVRLALSDTDLQEGEKVQIFYQTNRDCYIYIFSIAADGSVTLLLPNGKTPRHLAKAGQAQQFPDADSPIELKALFLPGFKGNLAEERIKIIATRQREDLLSLGFREGMFQVYDAKSTGMISDLVKRLNHLDPVDWTEATASYTLRR